jgi:hypothetical protein
MKTKGTQRMPAILILTDGNRGLPFAKEVGDTAAFADMPRDDRFIALK